MYTFPRAAKVTSSGGITFLPRFLPDERLSSNNRERLRQIINKTATDFFLASPALQHPLRLAFLCDEPGFLIDLASFITQVTAAHSRRRFNISLVCPAWTHACDILKGKVASEALHQPWEAQKVYSSSDPFLNDYSPKTNAELVSQMATFTGIFTGRDEFQKVTIAFYGSSEPLVDLARENKFHMFIRWPRSGPLYVNRMEDIALARALLDSTCGKLLSPWYDGEGHEFDLADYKNLDTYAALVDDYHCVKTKIVPYDTLSNDNDNGLYDLDDLPSSHSDMLAELNLRHWKDAVARVAAQNHPHRELWGDGASLPEGLQREYLLALPVPLEFVTEEERQSALMPQSVYTPENFPTYEYLERHRHLFQYLDRGGYNWLRNHYIGRDIPSQWNDCEESLDKVPPGMSWPDYFIGHATRWESGGPDTVDDEALMDARCEGRVFTPDTFPSYERLVALDSDSSHALDPRRYERIRETYMWTRYFTNEEHDEPMQHLSCRNWAEYAALMLIKYVDIDQAEAHVARLFAKEEAALS